MEILSLSDRYFQHRFPPAFKHSPRSFVNGIFFQLGQLTIGMWEGGGKGGGAQCLNELITIKLFEEPLPEVVPPNFSIGLDHYLKALEENNTLFFSNTILSHVLDKEINKHLFILSYLLRASSRNTTI